MQQAERNVLEITEAQYYFLALGWMEMFRANSREDTDADNQEHFSSMTTENLINLHDRVGPQRLKDMIQAELTIRRAR